MRRLLFTFFALMFAFISPLTAAAQGVTSDQLVLTIAEDANWSYLNGDEEGSLPEMTLMMQDGVPYLDFSQSTLEFYEDHQMVSGYAWSANMVPQYYEPVGTDIEIRVLTFADEQNAINFLEAFADQIVNTSPAEDRVAVMETLPESDLNMVGITSLAGFVDQDTGEATGMAGSARYLTQIGNSVISVEVSGPFVDYNFDVAFWLTEAQANCLENDETCVPATMPIGDDRWVLTEQGLVFVTEGDAENEWARWIFPLEDSVVAPEFSATIP